MNLETALARHLAATEDGVTFDETGVTGNTFIDTMPSTPDLAVAVTGSGANPKAPGTGHLPLDEPTVQIRVRSIRFDPRPGKTLAWAIYHRLVNLHATVLDPGGDAEVYVTRTTAVQSGPASIGRDANDRPEFVINLAFLVRALSAHRTN